MMETAQIYWRGTNSPPMTLEEAKAVTMEDFIGVFEVSSLHCGLGSY